MTREADVVQSLVDLADTLVADYDVVDSLTGLTDRCVHVLGACSRGRDARLVERRAPARGVVIRDDARARAVRVAGEGRSRAWTRSGPANASNTRTCSPGAGRWPHFATVAVEAGFRSAFALPLRLRDTTIGALNLVSVEQKPDGREPMSWSREPSRIWQPSASCNSGHRRNPTRQRTAQPRARPAGSSSSKPKAWSSNAPASTCPRRSRGCVPTPRSHNLHLTDVAQAAIDGTLDRAGVGGDAWRLADIVGEDGGDGGYAGSVDVRVRMRRPKRRS